MKSKHPEICQSIHDFGLSFVFRNPGDASVNLLREFYAGWDLEDEEKLIPIRGRLIDISATALSNHLGAPDVSHAL